MYNRDIKDRYIVEKIKEAVSQEDILRRAFENTSTYEDRLGKDVCNFSPYDIEDMYKTMNISSYESLKTLHSNLNQYVHWCLKERLVNDGLNHFNELDGKQLLNYVNKTMFDRRILSRDFLIEKIKELPNPSDGFIILGLFEGIRGIEYSDFENISINQINGNTLKLKSGREICISDELKNLSYQSADEFTYYSTSGTLSKKVELVGSTDQILKDYPNVKGGNYGNRFAQRLKRILNFMDLSWMRSKQFLESGQIEFVKKRAAELNITTKEYMSKNRSEIENQFNLTAFNISGFQRKYEKFLD